MAGLKPAKDPLVTLSEGAVQVVVPLDDHGGEEVEHFRTAVQTATVLFDDPDLVTVDLAGVPGGVDVSDVAAAAVGGVLDGSHTYRSSHWPQQVVLIGVAESDGQEVIDVATQAVHQARAARLARDLVNEPPSTLFPKAFADRIEKIADGSGLEVQVWEEAELERERLGGLLAVGSGSDRPPCLVRLDYVPDTQETGRRVVLVGKGVTFDSGGLSLKSAESIMDMKCDMAGAAAIVGAMSVLATLRVPHRVTAILPLAENMPGPAATRIGDVITTRSGQTIEMLNTDFEGRVLLSDALTLACEMDPDVVVDLATLTESAVRALGPEVAAFFATDESLATQVARSATAVGEPVWRLPLLDRYSSQLRSQVADLRNFPGSPHARAITAALFLREFIGTGVPWAHVDMAGPAMRGTPGESSATGFGARLLCHLLTTPVLSPSSETPVSPRKGSPR